jgi:hypothetical protein
MTSSAATTPTLPQRAAVDRYVTDIVGANAEFRYGRLLQRMLASDVEYTSAQHLGVVTVGGRTREVPEQFLRAVAGFRLGQYLALSYASPDVCYDRALHLEPLDSFKPDDYHLASFCEESGRLLGYVCLAGNGDLAPRPVTGRGRGKAFPVEVAHGIDVFSAVGAPALVTSEVREVKRFVHARGMTSRPLRLRVSMELLLALSAAVGRGPAQVRALVGDVEEQLALRHLLLVGLDVHVISGTRPVLARQDLMHPMYVTRDEVVPFFTLLPGGEELRARTEILRAVVASEEILPAVHQLLSGLHGSVVRHCVAVDQEVA